MNVVTLFLVIDGSVYVYSARQRLRSRYSMQAFAYVTRWIVFRVYGPYVMVISVLCWYFVLPADKLVQIYSIAGKQLKCGNVIAKV